MRPTNVGVIGLVMFLCFTWAYQQIVIKLALPEVGPMTQGAIRNGGACLLAVGFLFFRRIVWRHDVNGPGLLAGFLFGVEFVLIYYALTLTDASRATLMIYTSPFVVAIGEHLRADGHKLDTKSWIGISVAFLGVALTLGPGAPESRLALLGDALALCSGIAWGATTLVIKGSRLRDTPATQVLIYQLAIATVVFGIGIWISTESLSGFPTQPVTYWSLGFQVFWVASLSYGIWFALIQRYSATTLSVVTFITPLFGVGLGIGLLGETLRVPHIIGTGLVAFGIVLVSLPRSRSVSANVE
ncbi:MAG: DMT family transporter [Pseudomonadota bacterium]